MFGAGESTYPWPLLSSHLPTAVATSGGQGLWGREEATVQFSCLPPLPGQVQPQVRAISSNVVAPIRGKAISAPGYVGAHMLVYLIQPGWGGKLGCGDEGKRP